MLSLLNNHINQVISLELKKISRCLAFSFINKFKF